MQLVHILIAVMGVLLSGTLSHPVGNNTQDLQMRSLSIPDVPTDGRSTWPQTGHDGNGKIQPIRYCFTDPNSAYWLAVGLWPAVIEKWKPVTSQSALRIILDPGCRSDAQCVCSTLKDSKTGQPTDALNVRLVPYPTLESTECTVGYRYVEAAKMPRASGIHELVIAGFDAKSDDPAHFDHWVLHIAHELGHASGLAHEHQRPDRDQHIRVEWTAINGYAEAVAKVTDALSYWPGSAFIPECRAPNWLTPEECVQQVIIQNLGYADVYFPNAVTFMRADQLNGYYPTLQSSAVYDLLSIMQYDSYQGNSIDPDEPNFPAGAVLIGRGLFVPEFRLFMGGNSNKAIAGPSEGDLNRIQQLYPWQAWP